MEGEHFENGASENDDITIIICFPCLSLPQGDFSVLHCAYLLCIPTAHDF